MKPSSTTAAFRLWSATGMTPAVQAPVAPEAHSRFLHVTEQGAMLRRTGHRIRVTREKRTLGEVSSVRLQGVLLYGNVHVSTPCLRHLLEEGVWLAFFSRSGDYRGRIESPKSGCGLHRMRQWAALGNESLRLEFARQLVLGKIHGAVRLARQFAKTQPGVSLSSSFSQLVACLDGVGAAADIAALRGVEGTGARCWFELFRQQNRSALDFPSREAHGTHNPVNALLNLGYTLLLREWAGLLEGSGLDPIAGLYHETDGSRPSLACDMMEEYRHIVVDRMVLRLLNRGEIQAASFENTDAGVRLNAVGLRKFLHAWEETLLGQPAAGDAVSARGYRAAFLKQTGRLLEMLAGKESYRRYEGD